MMKILKVSIVIIATVEVSSLLKHIFNLGKTVDGTLLVIPLIFLLVFTFKIIKETFEEIRKEINK